MNYGILIYDGVEPIDLGATFGVLSMARRVVPEISMFSIARETGPVTCANGLRVIPDHGFASAPAPDVLIVTGGPGWTKAAACPDTLAWLRDLGENTIMAAICTGAMILAAAGRMDGHAATTKVEVIGEERPPLEILAEQYPEVQARHAVAVRSGRLFTSGGVSLGIDGVLYLLRHLHGEAAAREIARILEYTRALEANAAALPPVGFSPEHA